jgi:transcriptional regulator with XRE-family HTH domain
MQSRPITPRQMWMARLLLGWSRERLAGRAGTTAAFVWTFENEYRVMRMSSRNRSFDGLAAIRTVLEMAGVEFSDNGQVDVRLAKGMD